MDQWGQSRTGAGGLLKRGAGESRKGGKGNFKMHNRAKGRAWGREMVNDTWGREGDSEVRGLRELHEPGEGNYTMQVKTSGRPVNSAKLQKR